MAECNTDEKLAIDGGKPVRQTKLPPPYPGASVYGQEELSGVTAVIEAKSPFRYYGPNVQGKVNAYEAAMRKKFGVAHALGVTSCTASLVVALKAAGIGAGDKVVVPACTFVATPGAVVSAGAVPVFAEIDDTLNIDPDKLEDCVDEETKAVIVVPILGNPCQMDKIMEKAAQLHLIVIEDVAQSMGSKYKGRYCGTYGDLGCFSLQLNKILTTGEGGTVITNNDKLYERAVRYHDHGMFREQEGFLGSNKDSDIFIGQNYRMSEMTGAVACEQLQKLDDILAAMRSMKRYIKNEIKDIPGIGFRRIVDEEGDTGNAIIMLLASAEKSKRFRDALDAENVNLSYLYNGQPIYMVPQVFYKRTVDKSGFPFNMVKHPVEYSEKMCPYAYEILSRNAVLNITPALTMQDAHEIVAAIKKVAKAVL